MSLRSCVEWQQRGRAYESTCGRFRIDARHKAHGVTLHDKHRAPARTVLVDVLDAMVVAEERARQMELFGEVSP